MPINISNRFGNHPVGSVLNPATDSTSDTVRRIIGRNNDFAELFVLIGLSEGFCSDYGKGFWSRREELNTPSTDYDSAALTLSYTGKFLVL